MDIQLVQHSLFNNCLSSMNFLHPCHKSFVHIYVGLFLGSLFFNMCLSLHQGCYPVLITVAVSPQITFFHFTLLFQNSFILIILPLYIKLK